ncbi:MAG: hypothetical protein Q8S03_10830, partial [Brevundimonas sp.]|uniref:hypothetical protein n=1 Tax=Brevundimonas sp. TaxID=1871086 RepID=UPI0027336194
SAFAATGLALLLLPGMAAAQDDRKFNLECREFADPDTLLDSVTHVFSVDMGALEVCRGGNSRCTTIVDHGRFLEFSYGFTDGVQTFELFRLYDRRTGWLTQVMRSPGEQDRSYGDAVCEIRPFDSVGPA